MNNYLFDDANPNDSDDDNQINTKNLQFNTNINIKNENKSKIKNDVNPLDDFESFEQNKKENFNFKPNIKESVYKENKKKPIINQNLKNNNNSFNLIDHNLINNQELNVNENRELDENFEQDFINHNFNNNNNNNIINNNNNNNNELNINYLNLEKYDKQHNKIKDENQKIFTSINKSYLEKDNFYSKNIDFLNNTQIDPSTLINLNSEIDKEVLTAQINIELEEILSDENLLEKIKNDLFEYENSSEFTKRFYYNISPFYSINKKELNNFIFRSVRNDGDSFYKTIIYSYLENLIINKQIDKIKLLIFEISQKIHIPLQFNDIEINKKEITAILGIIYKNIEDSNELDAINNLNKAFSKNENFSLGLVKLLKLQIKNFIDKNGMIIQNIIENYNDKNQTGIKNLSSLIHTINLLEQMNTEPDVIIIKIVAYVLQINLKILAYENFEKKIEKININTNSNLNILLFYSNFSYKILYNKTTFNKFYHDFNVLNFEYEKKDFIQIFCENFMCENCGESCNQIFLTNISNNFPFCVNCLKLSCEKVIKKRIKNLIKEGYSNIEYYLRDIELIKDYLKDLNNSNKKYKISNPEFKFIFNQNLIDFILNSLNLNCQMCNNQIDENNNLITLPDGCSLCKNCIGELIIKSTDSKIVFNNFEKRFSKIKPEICICGLPFDYDSAIHFVYDESELTNYQQKAKERLKNYVKKYCLVCKSNLNEMHVNINEIGEEINNNNEIELFDDDKDELNYNFCFDKHKICNRCIKNVIKKNNNNVNEEFVEVDCIICNKKHKIKNRILKNIKKKDGKVTCCIIF